MYNVHLMSCHDIKSLDQSATNWLTLASKYLNPTLPSLAPGGGNLGQFPWSVEVMTPCWLLAEYRKCSRAFGAHIKQPQIKSNTSNICKGFIHSFRTPKNGLFLSIHEFWSEKFLEGANDCPVWGSCCVVVVTVVYKQLTLVSSKLTHQKNVSWAITDPPPKRRKVNGNSPKGSPLFCKTSLTSL